MSRIPVKRVRRSLLVGAVRAAVATVVLCAAAYTSAATLWVNDDAASYVPPGTNCLQAGYATIQGAVDAASPGDTINVCDGTYDENVVILTDDLTVVSTGGATATIIAPTTSDHVVEVRGTGLTLKDSTIPISASTWRSRATPARRSWATSFAAAASESIWDV